MKWFFKMMLPVLVLASCSKEGGALVEADPVSTGGGMTEIVGHESMRLGRKLKNPYSVENVKEALSAVYPTRSFTELVRVTDKYVRFLPKSGEEYVKLAETGIELFDHPLDQEVLEDGDWYHDPSIPEDEITWQYAVVKYDFEFPDDIQYEVIDECYIPRADNLETRGPEDVDWSAVEAKAFELTGNTAMLEPSTRAKSKPSGKVTIVDDNLSGGKAVGVAGVKMVANVFVKIATTYTDADGNYEFSTKFSAKPRYRLCFKNKAGFSIGFNLVLVPASVSTIGKGPATGIDVAVDKNSDGTLYRRCVVNNAAYDYIADCQKKGVTLPPSNIRFWILNILKPSCTLMMHHGTFLDNKLVGKYLGVYSTIVRLFAPDITIGSKGKTGKYSELYSDTVHEMAHATHFAKVGTDYWHKYATYIITSFINTAECYGTGNGDNAGYCEVGEMWGYYMENMLYKGRYGKNPCSGYSYWFKPQILVDLETGGVQRSDICAALNAYVTDIDKLQAALLETSPTKSSLIKKTFTKYSKE